jgi:hypothetical protein
MWRKLHNVSRADAPCLGTFFRFHSTPRCHAPMRPWSSPELGDHALGTDGCRWGSACSNSQGLHSLILLVKRKATRCSCLHSGSRDQFSAQDIYPLNEKIPHVATPKCPQSNRFWQCMLHFQCSANNNNQIDKAALVLVLVLVLVMVCFRCKRNN